MRKNSHIFANGQLKLAFCVVLPLLAAFFMQGQVLNAQYLEYIERYRAIALEHERTYGVPAAITLAQGLLESNAGRSYLAQRGNNHFGIKCYSWKGPVVEYDDTLKHNCYRNYGCAEDSFLDHARFLRGKRYSALYELEVSDYKGWAEGLRECGYAEDPAYPLKLINLIEQYELHTLSVSLARDVAIVSQPGESTASEIHAARVAAAFRHTSGTDQPSRAQVDRQVERSRPNYRRPQASPATNASADND